ncbi:MAG: antitoxin VapB family protein [Haloarculaceae archaeon]
MASKTISVKAETYRRLDSAKAEGESFSDVIDRLLRSQTDPHPLESLVGLGDEATVERLRARSAAFRDEMDDRMGTST